MTDPDDDTGCFVCDRERTPVEKLFVAAAMVGGHLAAHHPQADEIREALDELRIAVRVLADASDGSVRVDLVHLSDHSSVELGGVDPEGTLYLLSGGPERTPESLADARRTALALVKAHRHGDSQAFSALLAGTEDINMLVNALVQLPSTFLDAANLAAQRALGRRLVDVDATVDQLLLVLAGDD